MEKKRITTGTENFKEFLDNDYYYVDKSDLIKLVLKDKLSLFPRPRRFGKTLNMSMLYYFFSVKNQSDAYLFESLNISKDKEAMVHQNQYPVIFITLKDLKFENIELQEEKFRSIISNLIWQYPELIESTDLDYRAKTLLESYRNTTSSKGELMESLLNISTFLYRHYHQKVIILIDEYDVPLQYAYTHGYYDEMSNFLSNTLSPVLKSNDALEKAVLTGCLRIAKESIFTGLNNFRIYSIFDNRSSSYFGFTQDEVDKILSYYHLEKYHDIIKEWYDGYLFGNQEIYNPWSTLSYIDKVLANNVMPESFWANTSGNDIVMNYIKYSDEVMKEEFRTLMSGKGIKKTIHPELTYREMDDVDNIYSFLLFTGYLKIQKIKDNDAYSDQYHLVVPNKEVKTIFEKQFVKYFKDYTEQSKNELSKAFQLGDVKKANDIINDILSVSISFHDYDEKFYHGLLLGVLNASKPLSNQESGLGRYDIAYLPPVSSKPGYVIEVKVSSDLLNMESDCDKALTQIKDKQYVEGLKQRGYKNILAYGIAFHKKECLIKKLGDDK